jgi:N-ethylmaleimide reductase
VTHPASSTPAPEPVEGHAAPVPEPVEGHALFSPITVGAVELPNRLVMAPLTRLRSGRDGVPTALVAEHYAQRASVGLIVSEGTYPTHESRTYTGQPGIVTDAQIEGWRGVADAVHAAGGRIVLQIMHGGRVGHPAITGTDRLVAPSAIAIDGQTHTPEGKLPYPVPHELTIDELAIVREEIVTAARNAIAAGLDGVELHGANGYLLHEFLAPSSNQRTDAYGGSAVNRARFPIEVATAVVEAIGAGRVGLRLSPTHGILDVIEDDPAETEATYDALLDGIAPLGIAYVSVLHAQPDGELVQRIRARFDGTFIVNTGFSRVSTRAEALGYVADGHADAVAVGRPIIANPDLLERWLADQQENEPDPSTFYADSAAGYTDYPRWDELTRA